MNNYSVITTINYPTKAIEKLHELFDDNLIIVADEKTPNDWEYKGVKPIAVDDKLYSPKNHYARKNAGYLEVIKRGAELIYDTDDDNIPNDNWNFRTWEVVGHRNLCEGWFNVYKIFSDEQIWPRGFSLREVGQDKPRLADVGFKTHTRSSIQQGMADLEPDVDAIFRLIFNKQVSFGKNISVYLKKGAWCPFNSQSTWWFPKAYPLMYLPICAPFRMSDIWRSFVAQRCLWEINDGITFHSPSEVFQYRNEHDLMADFKDEISGYLNNDLFVETLDSLELKSGEENICDNMLACYHAVIDKGILPEIELTSLKQWIKDYENIT